MDWSLQCQGWAYLPAYLSMSRLFLNGIQAVGIMFLNVLLKYLHVGECLQRPKEGVGSPWADVSGVCVAPDGGAGNWTWVLWKDRMSCCPLSHLSRLRREASLNGNWTQPEVVSMPSPWPLDNQGIFEIYSKSKSGLLSIHCLTDSLKDTNL